VLAADADAVSGASNAVLSTAKLTDPHAVVVVDVSAGAPREIASVPFEGNLQESRLVGNVLYVAAFVYSDSAVTGWSSALRVTSFDLSDPAHPVLRDSVDLNGWLSAVHATDRFFLVANNSYPGANVAVLDISDPTGVIVRGGNLPIEGSVPDKFKMNVRGEIATVVSEDREEETWSPVSIVSTFSLADPANPEALGTLRVAPGEDLFATRFDGTRLYLVTAERQIDPLEIIDLSDPAQPTVVGQLQVPGFSTYIQPLGNRLVTTGIVNGRPNVALYDVSDPADPKQISSINLGAPNSWAYSEATWDEKAFSVLPQENLILLPLSDYDADSGYSSGVQIIDLRANRLVKRGIIRGGLYPRRATVHKERILSLSATNLIAVNATNRDQPVVTANLAISWNVDRLFLAGDHLLEVSDGSGWEFGLPPEITVTPANSPDEALNTLTLPAGHVMSATVRDGVLYVLQTGVATEEAQPVILSAISLGQLPTLKLLGQAQAPRGFQSYAWRATPLWVNDRTLIFAGEGYRSWGYLYLTTTTTTTGGGAVIDAMPTTVRPVGAAAGTLTLSGASDASVSSRFSFSSYSSSMLQLNSSANAIYPYYSYISSRSRELLAFDVTSPEAPKFASRLSLGTAENAWDVGEPLAAGDAVYASYRVVPRATPPSADTATAAKIVAEQVDANRHFLNVIDYSDSANPIAADGGVNLPGELRALSRQGTLLYTTGPALNATDGTAKPEGFALHATAFDGATAHLVDQLPLTTPTQPFALAGETVFLLNPQPAQIWKPKPIDPLPKPDPLSGATLDSVFVLRPIWWLPRGTWETNPLATTLETWRVSDEGAFEKLGSFTGDHELSLTQFDGLTVLRTDNRTIRLIDSRDPTNLLDLGTATLEGYGGASLTAAAADLMRGLWLPTGAFGVQIVPLGE
jgi:hypothetical protein